MVISPIVIISPSLNCCPTDETSVELTYVPFEEDLQQRDSTSHCPSLIVAERKSCPISIVQWYLDV